MFQHSDIDDAVCLGHADLLDKGADRLGRVATATQAGQRGHARVVPPVNVPLVDQTLQVSLAQHRIGQVETRELDLPGMIDLELVEEPVVQGEVVLVPQVA